MSLRGLMVTVNTLIELFDSLSAFVFFKGNQLLID